MLALYANVHTNAFSCEMSAPRETPPPVID